MKIKNEQDINGEVARDLRLKLAMPQHEFWNAVGVHQGAGCKFEKGATTNMTKAVRVLLFARYVVGLELDATSLAGVKKMHQLAKAQRALT